MAKPSVITLPPPPLAHALSGAVGAVIAMAILYPLDQVRSMLQVRYIQHSPKHYRGLRAENRKLHAERINHPDTGLKKCSPSSAEATLELTSWHRPPCAFLIPTVGDLFVK